MHWLTEPSHVGRRRRSGSRSGPARTCARSPASATAARTSARRCCRTRSTASYFGENWISVDKDVDYDDTLARSTGPSRDIPGLYRDVQTYLRERIKEVLTGTSESIVVRIFGPDLEVLREKADEISEKIAEGRRRHRRAPDFAEDLPHIEVELNLAAARRYGLKPGDIRRQSSTLLASEEVSDIFYGGRAYDVHVWSIPSARNSLTDVEKLPIDTPGGEQRAAGAGRRRAGRADAEPHPARAAVAPDRRRRERRGA